MKINKYLGRRASANQTQSSRPPLKKRALLIGIRNVREDVVEVPQGDQERTTEDGLGDANAAPSPKPRKKKKRKDNDTETPELKGPHRDVLEMKQLLIGALYHEHPFLPAKGILTTVV